MSARQIIVLPYAALVFCLFALSSIALAQNDATSIAIGQNISGELTAELSTATYSVTAAGGETAAIQVLAFSPGFAPRFRVVNPAGVEILNVLNPNGLNILVGNASFADAGVYLIEIQGESGSTGQFAISLQPGAALPDAVELLIDQLVSGVVGSQTPVRVYRFSTATADSPILTILSETPGSGPLVSLYDEDAGKTIASSDAGISGMAYRLSPGDRNYRVEVRASGVGELAFSICLGSCGAGLPGSGTVVETPEVLAAACTAASGSGGAVNVRSAPGTQFAIVGNLAVGQVYPALGQIAGGGWYQVNVNGTTGWVAASVATLAGDCASLPVVAAPANAPLASTVPPPTLAAPTNAPAAAPTATITPSQTPLALPDLTVAIDQATLNADGSVFISWTVSNIGTGYGAVDFWAEVCIDSSCSPWFINTTVPAGGSTSGSSTTGVAAPPAGLYYLVTVNVDVDNGIPESNEGNNSASRYAQ